MISMVRVVSSDVLRFFFILRLEFHLDPFNWKNEWTNQTIQQEDIGAGRNHQYTSRHNLATEWYSKWLPDQSRFDPEGGNRSQSMELRIDCASEERRCTNDFSLQKIVHTFS